MCGGGAGCVGGWDLWASKGQRIWDATGLINLCLPIHRWLLKVAQLPMLPFEKEREGQNSEWVGALCYSGEQLPLTSLPAIHLPHCDPSTVTKAHHYTFSKLSQVSRSINKRF